MSETVKTKSIKEEVVEMIRRLPDDCSLEDIQYHLHVRAKVGEALKDMEEGRLHSQEEVERVSAEWLKSFGRKQA